MDNVKQMYCVKLGTKRVSKHEGKAFTLGSKRKAKAFRDAVNKDVYDKIIHHAHVKDISVDAVVNAWVKDGILAYVSAV